MYSAAGSIAAPISEDEEDATTLATTLTFSSSGAEEATTKSAITKEERLRRRQAACTLAEYRAQVRQFKESCKAMYTLSKKVTDCPAAEVDAFLSTFTFALTTKRFDHKTWSEFAAHLDAPLYCVPARITGAVPADRLCVVIEMHNGENRIRGIGLIRNVPTGRVAVVHERGHYNRYNYACVRRVAREDMTPDEERLMHRLDWHCFYGKGNLKRTPGISRFPGWVLFLIHQQFGVHVGREMAAIFNRRVAPSNPEPSKQTTCT